MWPEAELGDHTQAIVLPIVERDKMQCVKGWGYLCRAHKALVCSLSTIAEYCSLHEQDIAPHYFVQLKKALNQYFSSTSFNKQKHQNGSKENTVPPMSLDGDPDPAPLKSFFIPSKSNIDSPGTQYESYCSSLWKLRDQVLSMSGPSFSRTVSERDWLKNSGKIWELVKNSSTISDYSRTLQNSGLFRR